MNQVLSSYMGDNIKCVGSIKLSIRRNDQNENHCQTYYFVEITGPAILGLPACDLLKFVSLDVDAVHKVEVGDIPNTLFFLEDTENINADMMNFSSTKQDQIRHKTACFEIVYSLPSEPSLLHWLAKYNPRSTKQFE